MFEWITENDTVKWGVNTFLKVLFVLGIGLTAIMWLQKILGLTFNFGGSLGI